MIKIRIFLVWAIICICIGTVCFSADKPQPTGAWSFEEMEGSEAKDLSGNENTGSLYNVERCDGKIGKAFSFNGTDSYIDCGNGKNINFSAKTPFSVTAWVWLNPDTEGTKRSIVGKSGAFHTCVHQDDKFHFNVIFDGINHEVIVSNKFPVGSWHHVAATYDKKYSTVFIDGQTENSQEIGTGVPFNEDNSLQIGGYAKASWGVWNGLIDEVKVYDRCLKPSEVMKLYDEDITKNSGESENSSRTAGDSLKTASPSELAKKNILIVGPFPDDIFEKPKPQHVSLERFPDSLEKLEKYSLIILSPEDNNRKAMTIPASFSEAQSGAIRKYILNGGAVLVTAERDIRFPGFFPSEESFGELLPVSRMNAAMAISFINSTQTLWRDNGWDSNARVLVNKDCPEFKKFSSPGLLIGGLHTYAGLKPETVEALYMLQPEPEMYGKNTYPVFAYSGRRGALLIPVSGGNAKTLNMWETRKDFLKFITQVVSSNNAGAFVTELKTPSSVTADEPFQFTAEIKNAEKKEKKYNVAAFLRNRKGERVSEETEKFVILPPGESKKLTFSYSFPANFQPGEFNFTVCVKDPDSEKFLHSLSEEMSVENRYDTVINKDSGLVFNDKSDGKIRVSTKEAALGKNLKLTISYHGKTVFEKDVREIKENETYFEWNTSKLPYGEYVAHTEIYDGGKILLGKNEFIYLAPEYDRNDIKIGTCWTMWLDKETVKEDLRNMHRLGMAAIRADFGHWAEMETPPVFQCKNCGKDFTFDELLEKGATSAEPSCIYCGSEKVNMIRQFDFTTFPDYLLPVFSKYGIETVIVACAHMGTNSTQQPLHWIYRFYSQNGSPSHLVMDQNNNLHTYAHEGWTELSYTPAHEEIKKLIAEWIKAMTESVKEYGPAVLGFQIENEPFMLFSSKGICDFNPANLKKFREYLEKKHGALEKVNELFTKNYKSWGEIEPPRKAGKILTDGGTQGDVALLAEFKRYEDELMAENIDDNSAGAKAADKNKMCGTNYVTWINSDNPDAPASILGSCDYWALAKKKTIDYIGMSNYEPDWESALLWDGTYSAASKYGKSPWITEGAGAHNTENAENWRAEATIFNAMFHGIRVHTLFVHVSDRGSVTRGWRLFNYDNSINEKTKAIGRPATFARDNCYLLRDARPVEPEVGLLLIPDASYITFGEDGTLWPHTEFLSFYEMLYRNNIPVRILRKEDLLDGSVEKMKILIVPNHKYGLEDEYLEAIRKYYKGGGNVITEMLFGEYDNYYRKTKGPQILEEIFGIEFKGDMDGTFIKPLVMKESYGEVPAGSGLMGSRLKKFVLSPDSEASVLVLSREGNPAVISRDNGKSSWLYIATGLPKVVSGGGGIRDAWERLILNFISKTGVEKPLLILDEKGFDKPFEGYVMHNPKNKVSFVLTVNKDRKQEKVCLNLKALAVENGKFYDFTNSKYLKTVGKDKGRFKTELEIPGKSSLVVGLLPEGVEPRETVLPSFRLAYQESQEEQGEAGLTETRKPSASYGESSKISKAFYPENPSSFRTGVPDKEGFIQNWMILGPFANPEGKGNNQIDLNTGKIEGRGLDINYLEPFGGEETPKIAEGAYVVYSFPEFNREKLWIEPSKNTGHETPKLDEIKIAWKPIKSETPEVDFGKLLPYPETFILTYAYCEIKSPEEKDALVMLGTDDGYKLWINGSFIHEYRGRRAVVKDQEVYMVHLKKGTNGILLKVDQDLGGFGFCFRITDTEAKPIKNIQINY